MLEGVTNLVASIFLGARFGALGVAGGTSIGPLVGLLGHVFYDLPRTTEEIELRLRDFLATGIGWPALASALLIVLAVFDLNRGAPNAYLFALALAVALLASALLIKIVKPLHLEEP